MEQVRVQRSMKSLFFNDWISDKIRSELAWIKRFDSSVEVSSQ